MAKKATFRSVPVAEASDLPQDGDAVDTPVELESPQDGDEVDEVAAREVDLSTINDVDSLREIALALQLECDSLRAEVAANLQDVAPLEVGAAVDPLGFGTPRTQLAVTLLKPLPREDLPFRPGDVIGVVTLPDGMDLDLFAQCVVRMRAAVVG